MVQDTKKLKKEGMMICEDLISGSEILFSNVSVKHMWTKQKKLLLKTKE